MRQMRTVRCTPGFMAVVVLVALAGVAASVQAQGTMGTVPDPISSRDIDRYALRLDLSRHQRAAVDSMHETYRNDFAQLREREIENFMNTTRGMGGGMALLMDRAATRKAFKDLDDILNKIRTIDNRFFDQVQSVLSEEQIAKIDQVRQMRERVRYRSGLSRLTAFVNRGITVDLGEFIDDMTLSPQEKEAITPPLVQYESSLTGASRKLYDATSSLVLEALDAVQTPDLNEEAVRDPERRMQMFQSFRTVLGDIQLKLADKAAEVNDLNRRSTRTLGTALAPENARALREEYVRGAYPEIRAGASTVSRAMSIVQKFKELTDEQRQTFSTLATEYYTAWDRLIDQTMDQIDANRKTQTFFDMDRDNRRSQGGQLSELREKRTKLNDSTLENLRAMLTPEQVERMDKLLASNKDEEEEMVATAVLAPGGGAIAVTARVAGPGLEGDAAISDPFIPRPMTRSDIDRYSERLNLAAEQRGLMTSLFADYQEAYKELEDTQIKEMREAQRSMWSMAPNGGPMTPPSAQAVDSLNVLRKRTLVAILELDKKFFDDLKVLLGDAVDNAKVERLHGVRQREIFSRAAQQTSMFSFGGRREIRGGGPGGRAMRMLGGEAGEAGVDLSALADSLDLQPSDPTAFDAALSEYEQAALTAFQKMYDAAFNMQLARDKMMAQMQAEREGERGPRMGDAFRGLSDGDGRIASEARRTVASLNKETMTRLAGMLPAISASDLRRSYNQKAYPEVFRDPRSAQPHIDAALDLGSLSDQQRAQVQEIALEFRNQYDELCDKLVEIDSSDPNAGAPPQNRDWQSFGERMRAREKIEFDRNDLNDRTLAKLRGALNETQVQQLGGLQPMASDND